MGFRCSAGFQLVCGDNSGLNRVEQTLGEGWIDDPVHPNGHIYAKTALNLIEMATPTVAPATAAAAAAAAVVTGRKTTGVVTVSANEAAAVAATRPLTRDTASEASK